MYPKSVQTQRGRFQGLGIPQRLALVGKLQAGMLNPIDPNTKG